ncbi:MAG: hypothetical protein HPY82_15705 [Gammaproteobacteria bacterium]|nr:hypothetical protein [Gammaproteobacteria bacterium]
MTMREWRSRPRDVANMFNPAFCAAIINRVAMGYQQAADQGIPYSLTFIALPLILHPNSSQFIPVKANSRMHAWVLNTPEVIFGFEERARSIAPIVRESVAFGVQNKIIAYSKGALITPIASRDLKQWEKRDENVLLCKQSQVFGKLLSQIKDLPTVFSLFGIRP